jgi:hypothetical protein
VGPWLPVNSALCGAVRVVRCAPEDVGKDVVVNVDTEGHGQIPSSFGDP